MTRKNKIACIALALVFVLMLCGFGGYNLIVAEAERAYMEKIKRYAEPYEIEKAEYSIEMTNLERELNDLLPCGSTMTLVVTSPDEMLYTEVYPIFSGVSKYNSTSENLSLVGTICISPTDLPGGDGNITEEQFSELLAEGWTTALYVGHTAASDLAVYLDSAEVAFASIGITMPNAAYFAPGAYSTEYDGLLVEYGIRNIVHHEEEGFSLIGADLNGSLWRAGDIGWNTTGVSNASFTALLANSGNLVFSLGFDENDLSRRFIGDEMGNSSFARMLDKFRECIRSGEMRVGSMSGAREAYKEYNEKYVELSPTLEPRRVELQTEIDRVNKILSRIYAGDFSGLEEDENAQ